MRFGWVALSLYATLMTVSVTWAQDDTRDAGVEGVSPASEAPPPHHDSSATAPMPEHKHGEHDHSMQGHAARHHLHDTISGKPIEFYGNVFIALEYNDPGKAGAPNFYLDSGDTVLGVRGGTVLDHPTFSKLRLFYQIESMVDLDEAGEDNRTDFAGHDTFAGATGLFGTVWAGKKRTAYTSSMHHFDHFHHIAGDYTLLLGRVPNVTSGSGSHHGGVFHIMAPDFLGYRSPTWNGVTGEVNLFGLNESSANSTLDDPMAYSTSLSFSRGSVMVAVAYETHENYDVYAGSTAIVIDKTEAMIAGLTFQLPWINTQLGGIIESISVADVDVSVPDKSREAFYLTAQKRFHETFVRIAYGVADDFELNDGGEYLAAGITQIIGKLTEVYLVYVSVDNKVQGQYGTYKVLPFAAGSDPSSVAMGIIHSF